MDQIKEVVDHEGRKPGVIFALSFDLLFVSYFGKVCTQMDTG